MIFRDKGLRLLRRSPLSSADLQGIAPCESPHTVIETKRGHCNTSFVTQSHKSTTYNPNRSLQHRFFNCHPDNLFPGCLQSLAGILPVVFLDVARYACKKTTANLLGQSTTISSGSNDLFGYKREGCRSLLTTCSPLIWWTCGESNSGPHKETIRFLHAYFSLGFSSIGKT